jgi:outer membrane PBP1 activator LpoA protein
LQLRKQNFPGAQKWLNKITNQKLPLNKKQVLQLLKTDLMVSQTNLMQAEKYFKKSNSIRVEYGYGFSCS